jgi:hypothetical protein
VAWEATHVDVTAMEAMQAANEFKSPTARDTAKQFLRDLLINGPVPRNDIDDAAKANGISTKTLFSAKNDLNVIAEKDNATADGSWYWRLPEEEVVH